MQAWIGSSAASQPRYVGTMGHNNSPVSQIDDRPTYADFPTMKETMQEALRYAPTTPYRQPVKKGINAPLQRFKNAPQRASPPPPPPPLDKKSLEGFEKLAAMQISITELARDQTMRKERHWEEFGGLTYPA